MARIAIAGMMHETNTFSPALTRYESFSQAADRPAMPRGTELVKQLCARHSGTRGFLNTLLSEHEIIPLVWAAATPSGLVEQSAFERIADEIVACARSAMPLDAVYLDLHGAMAAQETDDCEGELLTRLRTALGPQVLLVASLDFHANVSPQMARLADSLSPYRTYPHTDMDMAGTRAARSLARMLSSTKTPRKTFRQGSFLIPLVSQCTTSEPMRGLLATLEALEDEHDVEMAFTPGFPAADIADCGTALSVYGEACEIAADAFMRALNAIRSQLAAQLLSPAQAVRAALALPPGKPVIIADVQDNPGAGGTSDTVGMLRALLDAKATDSVLALLYDPAAALAAHQAGIGAILAIGLGALHGLAGETPVSGPWHVVALGNGEVLSTGPIFGGTHLRLGAMAVLERDGVRVVVSSRLAQVTDRDILRHVGISAERCRVLVLKSSVHFRADFEPIARAVLIAASPGAMPANPADLAFTRLRPGVAVSI
jgi:microcystin degradation protein MlrC